MADSEEIAGLKIGFSADVGELEASLVAARKSLNTWLDEQRGKIIKIRVQTDKDKTFDSIVSDMEKSLQSIADNSPNIKIKIAPDDVSKQASRKAIQAALSPITVQIKGSWAGWNKDGGPPKSLAIEAGEGSVKGKKGQAAAPAQATQGAGDCCDDIVQAIKQLGVKLEALVHAAPGQSNVKERPAKPETPPAKPAPAEKPAKTSPSAAAKAASENAPAPATSQAAAKAPKPAAPAPTQAGPQPFEQWWAKQRVTQQSYGPERPKMTKAEGRVLYDKVTGAAPARQRPVEPRAEEVAEAPAPAPAPVAATTRKEADAARAARQNVPWTCPDCGVTLATSKPSRISAHKASSTHTNRAGQRTRATQRAAASAPAAALPAASADEMAAYRDALHAEAAELQENVDLSQVPYRSPTYTGPTRRRWMKLPSTRDVLTKQAEMDPDFSRVPGIEREDAGTRLPYIDESGLAMVSRGGRRTGRRGTRLARNLPNVAHYPALETHQALLARRRQILEENRPLSEGEQIRDRILETGGAIVPGASMLESAFRFGKELPAPEREHITARLKAAGAAAVAKPAGGRTSPITGEEFAALQGELGRTPSDNEIRQRMIQLEQGGNMDPLEAFLADLGSTDEIPKVTWDDLGWGTFDADVRKALSSRGGERDDAAHALLDKMGLGQIPKLSEQDPDFAKSLTAITDLVTGNGLPAPQFASAIAAIEPEMRNLRAQSPKLTSALQRGFLLPKSVPADAPAMQVQKRFLALSGLREAASAGMTLGALGEEKAPAMSDEAMREYLKDTAAELGVDVETLMPTPRETKAEGSVMATAATQGGAGRRAWLLGRQERTPEQQKELESLSAVERARRRARFAERLSTTRGRKAAAAPSPSRRPRWMPEKVGTRYPRPPASVRAIADERQAGIEYMARLFSYGERTSEEEEQLGYLQGQYPRAVRTARDLYPAEEPEETETRKAQQALATSQREIARLRTLIRNEGNLSPLQGRELKRLEGTYPAMAKYTRDPGSVSSRPLRGLGADIDPLEALRSELGANAGRLGSAVGELSTAGGGKRAEHAALAGQLEATQRDLELLDTYFPTGKYADPVKTARRFVSTPLKRPTTTSTGRRQAASLILARQKQENEGAPSPAAAKIEEVLAKADAYIAGAQQTAVPSRQAAQQAPVQPTTRAAGGRYRYQTRRTAGGRMVAQSVSRALSMRSGESFEKAVARMHRAGQLNDNLRDQILGSTAAAGRSLDEILAAAVAPPQAQAPAAPQQAVAAGAGAPPSPAAAAGAAAARQPAAGAVAGGGGGGAGGGGGGGGGGGAGGGQQGVQQPVTPPPTGVRYRSLNAIVQSARERGVGEERLAPLALQQNVGRVPDFPNPFQQTRLFGRQQPGMLPAGSGTPTLQARLLSARAGVAEQVQLTPVRALSVAFGQYAATIGARGGVRGRQLEFESLSGRAQKAVNLEEDALYRRRALVEERKQLTIGSKEYEANTQELRGVRMQHRVLHKEAARLTRETEQAAKGVSTLGTQFANLAFGAAGIVGGTLAFGATLAVGQAVVGALAEAAKPMTEQITGFTERIRGVTEGLKQGALPTGDVAGTVAGALSQAGVGGALAQSLGGPLAQRTQQAVQNERLSQTVDLMRTAFQTRMEDQQQGVTNYRGVYQPTGGLNLLGFQTNIGAQQSFLEQAGLSFQQSAGNSGMFNRLLRPDMSFADVGAAAQGNPFAQFYTNEFDQSKSRARYDAIRQQSLDNLSIFEGTQQAGVTAVNPDLELFEGRGEVNREDRLRQAELLRPIAPDVADAITAGSLAFVDEAGNVVTSLKQLDQAFNAAATEFAKPDAGQLIESMKIPLQAAVMGIQDNLDYQLTRSLPASRAMQRLTAPPLPFGFGMTGAPGAAGEAQAGALAQFPGAAGLMTQRNQLRQQDRAALLQIPGVDPAMVQQLEAYGDEVVRVQTAMSARQNNMSAMQYNEQLRLATQQYGDLLGLAGQVGSVEQSRVGQLERQNMLISRHIEDLGREAQAMQLMQSQRQINFQLATSRFTSSGATPAEAAAQARYAEQQAAFAQTQLNLQKEIFDEQGRLIPNQREIQDTGIERQVEALENAINLMEEGFATEQFVRAGQSYLDTLAGANAGLIDGMSAIVGAGQQIDQLAIQTRNQIFAQTGEDVDIIKDGTREVFEDLLDQYDNFASRIQVPGFEYEPREDIDPTTGQPVNTGSTGPHAAGAIFEAKSPTTATFGEAGSETVAILRNPRTHLIGTEGSSANVNLTVQFNGEVSVREDQDIDRIAHAVKQLFNRETELLGLRR